MINHKNKDGNIIFRSSGVHALLTKAKGTFTEANQIELDKLKAKKKEVVGITENQQNWLTVNHDKYHHESMTEKQKEKFEKLVAQKKQLKQLTETETETLNELLVKKEKPFEFSQTAKNFIEGCWLQNEYGYREILMTKQLQKGNMAENDSIKLAVAVLGIKDWVKSNKERRSNLFFTGEWDVLINTLEEVWEIKTCWSLKTFMAKKEVDAVHETQVQVYGDLLGVKKHRVIYCLVKTPASIIEEEIKSLFFKYGCDEENVDYQKARVQIMHNNNIIDTIPEQKRIKQFSIPFDAEKMLKLKSLISGPAQDYYNSIEVNQIKTPVEELEF